MNILTTECPIKSWMNSMEKMVGNIIEYNKERYNRSSIICVPDNSIKWNENLTSILNKYFEIINVPNSYSIQTNQIRKQIILELIKNNDSKEIILIGHSEGCALLMHLLETKEIANKIKGLILISPVYTFDNTTLDITNLVNNIIDTHIDVFLINAKNGFKGSLPCFRWSGCVQFKKRMTTPNYISKHIILNSEQSFMKCNKICKLFELIRNLNRNN